MTSIRSTRLATRPLDPFGVEVLDVDLTEHLTIEASEAWRDALAEHGVVVVRDQTLDDDGFAEFLRALGPLAFTAGERAVPGHPDLNVVTNAGRTDTPVSNWHVDTAYVDRPPAYTALRAVVVPAEGGETVFADQVRAADNLPLDLAGMVAGRRMTHVVTGVDPGPGEQTAAEHPLLRPHPRSGRPALYLDAPTRCAAISGLDDDTAMLLAARLLTHSTRSDNVLAHRWRPGDVVIWDNAVVLHRADHSGVRGERTFHRGMVGADGHHGATS